MSSLASGSLGEKVARLYLASHGYRIIERNWHCRYGEIDIICLYKKVLVFVEVKMRSNNRIGGFSDYVNHSKLRKLEASIDSYLCKNSLYDIPWRLDGVYIIKESESFRIRHFRAILEY